MKNKRKCPYCSSKDIFWFFKTKTQERSDISVNICNKCGLTYTANIISVNYKKYQSQKRVEPERSFSQRISSGSFAWRRYKWILEHIKKRGNYFPKKILEVGTADGANLYPWFISGCKVEGYDFEKKYLMPGKKTGLNLHSNEKPLSTNYDLIIISHVLEHINDINSFLNSLLSYLTDKGLIYIEVPGIFTWLRKYNDQLIEEGYSSSNKLSNYFQDGHISHFSKNTLENIFSTNNLKIEYIDEKIRCICVKNHDKSNFKTSKNSIKKIKLNSKSHFEEIIKEKMNIYILFRKILSRFGLTSFKNKNQK